MALMAFGCRRVRERLATGDPRSHPEEAVSLRRVLRQPTPFSHTLQRLPGGDKLHERLFRPLSRRDSEGGRRYACCNRGESAAASFAEDGRP